MTTNDQDIMIPADEPVDNQAHEQVDKPVAAPDDSNEEPLKAAGRKVNERVRAESSDKGRIRGAVSERRAELSQKLEAPVSERPSLARLKKADLVKLGGLALFLAMLAIVAVLVAPWVSHLGSAEGRDMLVDEIRSAGPLGVLILLGMQLLQIIVAFIPGEAIQWVAGMMYGPIGGTLIILAGCVVSSALLYSLVHRLGAPFVRDMIPEKWMNKLTDFEQSDKMDLMVFILFLIPGMPKDILTYLVPLTEMPMKRFVTLSNVARIPGVLMSTFAADGLLDGNFGVTIGIAVVVGAIAVVAVIFRDRIMGAFRSRKSSKSE